MIVDRLNNFKLYNSSVAWKKAFDFLAGLNENSPEGKFEIQGQDIFCSISRYETLVPWECALEAHRKYVDIQIVLDGAESIDWYPINVLTIKDPYDNEKDVEFYNRMQDSWSRIDLCPGIFAVFFPSDAHMPRLMIGEFPKTIKKAVIKIRADLLK
jgi:biofilm protein TabA